VNESWMSLKERTLYNYW